MVVLPALVVAVALVLVLLVFVSPRWSARCATALVSAGKERYRQAQYQAAEASYRKAAAIRERILGPDHPAVATVLNSVGLACRAQCRYDEAEAQFLRALKIYETHRWRTGPTWAGRLAI